MKGLVNEVFVEVKQLCKKYPNGNDELEVLKKVTFSAEKSDVVVIIGPSGSGKSTFLNIIGGLEHLTSGDIMIDNMKLSGMNEKQLSEYRRKYVGFVFQFYNLIPNLTVKENIEVCQNLGQEPLNIDELIQNVGLKGQEEKFPNQLSGGQQQRVAVARALIKNPSLLLCDEPTGALDYNNSKEILTLFEEVNKKYGTTIIMITHNEAIKEMANRVVKIKDGQIVLNEVNNQVKKVKEIEW